MKSWYRLFNLFLALALMVLSLGCQTAGGTKAEKPNKKKVLSTLRVYLEVNPDGSSRNKLAQILRDNPVLVNVDSVPVLTEALVGRASVIATNGLFSLEIQFNDRGTRLLEMVTIANKGQRLAIYSDFGASSRWLAAPLIKQQISDGKLIFTPDATREEADRIVRGLNNVAAQAKKRYTF